MRKSSSISAPRFESVFAGRVATGSRLVTSVSSMIDGTVHLRPRRTGRGHSIQIGKPCRVQNPNQTGWAGATRWRKPLLLRQIAAVDGKVSARHEGGLAGCQPYHQVRDFGHRAEAVHRVHGGDGLEGLLVHPV